MDSNNNIDDNKIYNYDKLNFHELIRKNSVYILIERLISPVINFIVAIIIIRTISTDDYGIYNMLLAILGYIFLFSSVGIPEIFMRYIPEFFQKKQIKELKDLVKLGLFYRLILCLGFLLLIIIFSKQLGQILNIGSIIHYLAIFSVAIVTNLLSGLLGIVLTSVFQHKNYSISQVSYFCIRALLIYYLLKSGKGLIGLLIAESVANVYLLLVQYIYYRKYSKRQPQSRQGALPFKRILKFGGYSFFNQVGSKVLEADTDYFIISAFLGPAAVGIYAFANRVISLSTHFLPNFMLSKIINPAFFSKYSQDKNPIVLNKMYNFLIKFIAFFSFPVFIGVIVLGEKIILYIFDPKYIESLDILIIVAAFISINYLIKPTGMVLKSVEKVQILFYSKIFAVYNLIANILVVKKFGIIGVALVTCSAVLFKNIYCYLYAKKYASLVTDIKSLLKIAFNSICMGFLLYLIRDIAANLVSLLLVILIGMLIYFCLAFLNKAFSVEERKFINKVLPKSVFVF